jgi:hypothetical protein
VAAVAEAERKMLCHKKQEKQQQLVHQKMKMVSLQQRKLMTVCRWSAASWQQNSPWTDVHL